MGAITKAGDFDAMRHPKKRAMLAALANTGIIGVAASIAKTSRQNHSRWMEEDQLYKALAEVAIEHSADLLEAEAVRRATQGVKEPVYQGGKRVGYITRFSDLLLIFTLKGRRPHKFRDRFEHSGPGGAPLPAPAAAGPVTNVNIQINNLDLKKYSDDELSALERLLEHGRAESRALSDPGGTPAP